MNEDFTAYKQLSGEIQDIIDKLIRMDNINEIKGSRVFHMNAIEINQLLNKLKRTAKQ